MSTEPCYRCGVPLLDYFTQLCPKCRTALEEMDDDECFPSPGSYDDWKDDWS